MADRHDAEDAQGVDGFEEGAPTRRPSLVGVVEGMCPADAVLTDLVGSFTEALQPSAHRPLRSIESCGDLVESLSVRLGREGGTDDLGRITSSQERVLRDQDVSPTTHRTDRTAKPAALDRHQAPDLTIDAVTPRMKAAQTAR
jgi:hypothetical protein